MGKLYFVYYLVLTTGPIHELKYKVHAKDKASALSKALRLFKKDGHNSFDIFTQTVILGY
jgi:hypothetical protein